MFFCLFLSSFFYYNKNKRRPKQFFAPTEAAFDKVPQATMDYLASNAGRNDLKELLSRHIVMGVIPSSDLTANSTTSVTSLQGSNLTVAKLADGQVGVNGIATVETPDVVSLNTCCYRPGWEVGPSERKRAHTVSPPSYYLHSPVSFSFFSSLRAMALSISLIRSWMYLLQQKRRLL
jgi:Fasciclin domain